MLNHVQDQVMHYHNQRLLNFQMVVMDQQLIDVLKEVHRVH